MIRIEFEGCTVSAPSDSDYETCNDKLIRACEAVLVAAGYSHDTFREGMINWLSERDFVVMTQEEYESALDEARKEVIDGAQDCKTAQSDYNAGYNDGYNGEDAQDDQSPEYYDGYYTGKELFEGAE